MDDTAKAAIALKGIIDFMSATKTISGLETQAAALLGSSLTEQETIFAVGMNTPNEEHKRVQNYSERVAPEYSEDDYIRLFRVTRNTFNIILDMLCSKFPNFQQEHIAGLTPLSAHKKLEIALTYLATTEPMRRIGDLFGVCDSTVMKIRDEVVEMLCDMKEDFIKWPTEREAAKIAQENLALSGYPGVIGSVDGSHILAKIPKAHASSYINRKMSKSMVLQGVCTFKKLLTHTFIGAPGRIHDSRVMRLSSISKIVHRRGRNALFYRRQYHLIGDSAYGWSSWLLTPYKGQNLTVAQKNYNKTLSRSRVKIENVFGLIKGRWQRTQFVNVYKLKRIPKIVTACCVLHNICYINDDYMEHLYYEDPIPRVELPDPQPENNVNEYAEAVAKREAIKAFVNLG